MRMYARTHRAAGPRGALDGGPRDVGLTREKGEVAERCGGSHLALEVTDAASGVERTLDQLAGPLERAVQWSVPRSPGARMRR